MLKDFDCFVFKFLNEGFYELFANCKEFECGNDVQEIVQQDDFTYGEETYNHNPELQISPKEFYLLTGKRPKRNRFYGHNKDLDIVFSYDPSRDIHYFYRNIK
jgi:hypothetical protein